MKPQVEVLEVISHPDNGLRLDLQLAFPKRGTFYVEPEPKKWPVRVFQFNGTVDMPDCMMAAFYGDGSLTSAIERAEEYADVCNLWPEDEEEAADLEASECYLNLGWRGYYNISDWSL